MAALEMDTSQQSKGQRSASSRSLLEIQPEEIVRWKRYAWRLFTFVPMVSTIVLCESPSFDDIEKTLNLIAIINTLMLGCVAGSCARATHDTLHVLTETGRL
jgi:hypothetical protein